MVRFVLFRLLQSLIALAMLSVVVFVLARATGDPLHMILPMNASEEDYVNARKYLGLDRPYVEQYLSFVGRALTGDFGTSLRARRPVGELIAQRLPNSLRLAAFAMTVSLLLAFPLGVLAAVWKGTGIDRAAQVIAVLGQSLPTFWVAIVLIELVAGRLQWLPAAGYASVFVDPVAAARFMVLPAVSLGFNQSALIARISRSFMLEVLAQDYIRTARAKGLSQRIVVWVHAFRNALVPVVTVIGVTMAVLIGGAVVTEIVFNIPGLGRLIISAILRRDYPVVQGVVLVTAAAYVLINLVVDVANAFIDPRIRYE